MARHTVFLPEIQRWVTLVTHWGRSRLHYCDVCGTSELSGRLYRCSARRWGWACCRRQLCTTHVRWVAWGQARCARHSPAPPEAV